MTMLKANINDSSHQELLSCCFFDHVSPDIDKLWLLLCYLRVSFQLASPPGYYVTHIHPEGESYIYICIYTYVFFWPFGIFFSLGRGSLFMLSAPWHAESPLGLRTQVWALAEVRGTRSSGSKWQVRSGRDSEHVEPSRRMLGLQVVNFEPGLKKCPTVHTTSMILNGVNVTRVYLVMATHFPDT